MVVLVVWWRDWTPVVIGGAEVEPDADPLNPRAFGRRWWEWVADLGEACVAAEDEGHGSGDHDIQADEGAPGLLAEDQPSKTGPSAPSRRTRHDSPRPSRPLAALSDTPEYAQYEGDPPPRQRTTGSTDNRPNPPGRGTSAS